MLRSRAHKQFATCAVSVCCFSAVASAMPLTVFHLSDPRTPGQWRWLFSPEPPPKSPDELLVEQAHAMPEAAPAISLGAGDGLGKRIKFHEMRIAQDRATPAELSRITPAND